MSLFDPIDELFGVTGEDPGQGYSQAALDAISRINPPSADDLKVQLQKLVYQGDITPEQAQTFLQNPSMMAGIQGDPAAKGAQSQALSQLAGISTQGGLTPMDKAQLEDVMGKNAAAERGSREAILMNARERGNSGSGNELLDQMVNSQESATRGQKAGLDVAAQARERALQAMTESGQLGGQMEGQAYAEQAAKAQAQDAINKFNATNKNTNEAANVAARNAFIDRNAQEKQRISDTNTGVTNTQATMNAAANQTAFDDQMKKVGGVAGAYGNLAAGKTAAENSKRAFEGQLLGTAGSVAGGYMATKTKPITNNYVLSDKTKKKDVKDAPGDELDAFLASLDPKTFQYKDPGAPGAEPGNNVGVLAQDIEKTAAGKTMVKNTPDGKVLDMQKGFSLILAALGKLHDEMENGKGAQVHA